MEAFSIATHLPFWDIVLRLAAALALSLTVGWEREAKDKPAGVATHMIVAVGAAAFMIVALELAVTPSKELSFNPDPSRVIQGVIGGIGFLGAGSIIRNSGEEVKGLKTGAGIWVVGAIGLACGAGYFVLAALIGGAVLFVQVVVRIMQKILGHIYSEAADAVDETVQKANIAKNAAAATGEDKD